MVIPFFIIFVVLEKMKVCYISSSGHSRRPIYKRKSIHVIDLSNTNYRLFSPNINFFIFLQFCLLHVLSNVIY